MGLLFLSFLGGVLTIASPCVLPMLPVIVGSIATTTGKKKPLLIVASLSLSIVIFTLLLKWSTALLNIPSSVWPILSGSVIIILGITLVFPQAWTWLMLKVKLQHRSEEALQRSSSVRSTWLQPILTGAALGPVFSSCSPTYFFILATILPQTFAVGLINLLVYAAGLAITLLVIALFGRRATQRLKFASNPDGWFRRGLGILLVSVGLLIITGIDKKIETFLVDNGISSTGIEGAILDQFLDSKDDAEEEEVENLFNVNNPKNAPQLVGLTNWINTAPLTLEKLKGKVVIIDFWTYSCINCIRTLPFLNAWHTEYADDGLVIIGVHAPEFAFEHIPENVQSAIDAYDINYPVVLDNNFLTWRAYNNRYWPAKYFIDREGKVRHTHFGEGDYEESESVIRALLAEDDTTLGARVINTEPAVPASRAQTPETYFGYQRMESFLNNSELRKDTSTSYTAQVPSTSGAWSLEGEWLVSKESATTQESGSFRINVTAQDVYIVASATEATPVEVLLNGLPIGAMGGKDSTDSIITITTDKLYHVAHFNSLSSNRILELRVPSGVSLYAATFGS